ncbi:homeobox protein 5 isoform X22 [Ceratitis capitata]|uniref:homeobox protein 5 isoform X22 n=1 Tax=Ceratitis capitata TaxID=7213 RepID=UPI000A1139B4|nr:homeobox protein 5 isoform X22 [Ceratitis capitata]
MDLALERDCTSALGSLFQQIINDLKNTSPLWEDFVTKATKLHQCLRAAIQAIAAYLDAFQKIADAATNSRGASKEIGTALTRVCLRHKAVESRLKTFTTAIMDCLVQPLQEKLEDWKRTVITIDKEHAKEYKRCRTELKKRSSDTLRLQKKARKGQSDTIQTLMDSHKQDVTLRRAELEEVEKKSLRSAMIEERLRYCTFVHMLQPVVKEECEVMSELGHLQEAMDSIAIVTKDPSVLPQTSEELIQDTKATMTLYPESPGGGSGSQGGCSNSLGSRKSSVCSISSMNSSGSSNSPGHHHYPRSLSQLISPAIRLKPGESSDSGFCSSPALTTQASTATSQSHAVSTWPPHSQDAVPVLPPAADRPHTISTAYEKGHQRPPLTVYTFQNPETILEGNGGSGSIPGTPNGTGSGANTPCTQKSPAGALNRPPLPVRCSSLERPLSANNNRSTNNLLQRQCPSPIPAHITKELSAHHAQQQHIQQQQQQQQQQLQQQAQQQLQSSSPPPTYVNMSELANMAATKIQTNQQQQQQQQQRPVAALQQQHSIDSISSQFSNDSTASGQHSAQQQQQGAFVNNKARSHSASSSSASSNTPSLYSHPSIESGTVTTPLVGQTPTPSSGSSTPQNHYSPLLTNSPSSTAAGTPSGCSVASGMLSGFVCNVNSPTPPQSGTTSIDSDVLKITETDGNQPTQLVNVITNDATVHQQQQQQQQQQHVNNITNNAANINSQTNPTAETLNQTPHTNATNSNSAAIDTESPTIVENDERSRASVLQKASMFEKQAAAAAASTAAVATGRSTNSEAIYGTRRNPDEVYRSANTSSSGNHYQQPAQQPNSEQQDVDKSFEDSIQELNNLIGELDSFQREIDASKRSTTTAPTTAATTPNADNFGENCGDRPFPLTSSSSEASTGVGDYNDAGLQNTNTNTTTTVITVAENSIGSTPLTVMCPARPPKSPQCASNQTSGCGTDLSDAASDDIAVDVGSLSSINNNNNNKSKDDHSNEHHTSLGIGNGSNGGRTLQQYNSDSELSRCYVSETSSLAGGYENPTFAHFATAVSTSSIAASSGVDEPADVGSVIGDGRSLMAVSSTTTADDCMSHTSETYPMQSQNAYNTDNVSDGGSNVVVIYDHQIPITPDIDYVKQNSEIVVLRTKDPLQQQLSRQEMRELTQLPNSLCAPLEGLSGPGAGMMSVLALSSSSLSCSVPTSPPHTATVTPAKQRLSSFRASSEQQLQLLGCGDNNNSGSELSLLRTPHLYANAGTPQAQDESRQGGSRRVATPPNAHNSPDTIIRRKAAIPPKPSLSIFNGPTASNLLEANSTRKSSSSISRASCETVGERLAGTPTPPPPLLTKANFKADLDAKIRKQKLKLQLQREQQQHQELLQQRQKLLQQQQQLQQQSPQSVANNTNSPIYRSSNGNHNNHNHSDSNTKSNNTTSSAGNHTNNTNSNSSNNINNNCNAISLNKLSCSTATATTTTTTKTTTASAPASASNHLAASSHHIIASASASASASSSFAGPQLVYQNGTKSSSNSNNNKNKNSSRSSSSAFPKAIKQTHSNRTPNYQFHALKSHNNNNNNNTPNIVNAKTRPKRSASTPMSSSSSSSSIQKSSNAMRAPSPITLSSTSSLSLCSPTTHSSIDRRRKYPQSPRLQTSMAGQQNQTQNHHSSSSSTSSPSSPSSVSVSSCAYACSSTCASTASPPQPPPIHTKQSASAAASVSTASASASNSNINSAIAKPNITPRPASLSGGVTRIARRSSVNSAKPPPPVRRSSSVTPSHNATSAGSFRTSSPGIYAQPKAVPSMSSFRSASPATNDHHSQHHHVIPPTQPKTNPNLIAQLNARLSKQNQHQQLQQQQQHTTNEGIYGSTPNSPSHHNLPHQHQHHQSEPVYMRNYSHPHQQQQQQQHQVAASGSMHQQQNYDAAQISKHQPPTYAHSAAGGTTRHYIAPTPMQQPQHHRESHHSCPPPLENPPPPPTNSSIYAATATATMPKNATRASLGGGGVGGATYAPPTSTMTLPKNLAQQRLQQQQHYQQQQQQQHYQQQQYQHSTATAGNVAAQQQQYAQTATASQRAQIPLPHQQQQQQQQQQLSYKQKSATLQSNHRQPPVPSRHSSVQQKIFVATNPFIQTTTIHCHSPASVHSQPASPTCSSPSSSSLASIYGTSSRSHHHHQLQQQHQQQQQLQHHAGGGNAAGNGYYAAPHNSTASYASSNIEKAGSIRSKTKAEFLENLNAKLAKQGLSGRAFAVRNLINSKALPDPRICHESLMDQIKRGATLKRNQKINDRSAPKIH